MAGEAKGEKEEAAAPPSTDIVVDLKKPVMANGEMVKKLTFREPTGADMVLLGEKWPINIDWQTGEVSPNPAVMGIVISQLGAVPPSTVKAMGGKDFATVSHRLMGFFVPDAQAMQF
jgi:Phage tail assembly chaperone proteins, E, or 41 or 14